MIAINTNNFTEVQRLIENGVDVNKPIEIPGVYQLYPAPPILWAFKSGIKYSPLPDANFRKDIDINIIRALINAGAKVNVKNIIGQTPLHLATHSHTTEYTDAVDALIKAGANVDAVDNEGVTPLLQATVRGHIHIVKALLDAEANVNVATPDVGLTPLQGAASHGYMDAIRALLAAGAKVNTKNIVDKTALYFAAESGHTDAVRELLEAGADVDAEMNDGSTPLYAAVKSGHVDVVRALVKAGANVDATTNRGATPINISKNPEIYKVLTETQSGGSRKSKKSKKRKTRRS